MKDKTLNQTWTLCLRMWRKIAKKWTKGSNIFALKREWIRENGFSPFDIDADCFFCDYADGNCSCCPGTLVDVNFFCEDEAYSYETNPPAFYKELLRLNRIRKGKR